MKLTWLEMERVRNMAQLNPYLRFGGKCKEAMTFYQECLGGDLVMLTVGESPQAALMPGKEDLVFHSLLRNDSLAIMGSDLMGEDGLIPGNTISFALTCESKEELEALWEKLSAGGTIGNAPMEAFFGTIGDFIDKFGFAWLLVLPNPDQM